MSAPRRSLRERVRRRLGRLAFEGGFEGLASLGRLHPRARPERHGVAVTRNVAYRDTGLREHLLDIYRPAQGEGPWPAVLYVHGGGFRILSKDSHWLMGLAFARRGHVVFNVSYRLAPRHPYPAAIEDACHAYAWVTRNAARFGGDAGRLVLAGESAGANLVASLAVAACYQRPEPWAREVFATGVVPRAVVAACGIFQVSDVERFARRRPLPWFVTDRLEEVAHAYLDGATHADLDLADPLVVLERGERPARSLPAFFVPVGTRDPLLDDTRRLAAALARLGGDCDARYYPGEAHAFHALVWRPAARQCWRDTFAFLERHP